MLDFGGWGNGRAKTLLLCVNRMLANSARVLACSRPFVRVGLSRPGLAPRTMAIARIKRAANSSRETAALGDGPHRQYEDRAQERARQQHFNVEEEDEEAEEEEQDQGRQQQQQGYGPKPSLPNLAVHFAELTNAVLRRVEDEGTNDKRFGAYVQKAKKKLICDLKSTYNELYNFYNDPSKEMPSWLSKLPPAKSFFTHRMDLRLLSKKLQIQQELHAFVEELGFVCLEVYSGDCIGYTFTLRLRLDVATVPTTEARKRVKNRLLSLEGVH